MFAAAEETSVKSRKRTVEAMVVALRKQKDEIRRAGLFLGVNTLTAPWNNLWLTHTKAPRVSSHKLESNADPFIILNMNL
jgi:hypothetical protein